MIVAFLTHQGRIVSAPYEIPDEAWRLRGDALVTQMPFALYLPESIKTDGVLIQHPTLGIHRAPFDDHSTIEGDKKTYVEINPCIRLGRWHR